MKFTSLEKINKNVLYIALILLIFRQGSFSSSSIPNPFEIFFVLIVLLSAVYVTKDHKFKDLLFSVPRKLLIAGLLLLFSVLLGWSISIFLKHIPFDFNMILEFGAFVISLGTFLLVFLYAKNDPLYAKKYFYALLVPVVYILVILFPSLGNHLHLVSDQNFLGFTTNRNIIYKILLIPVIFFITRSLFESKNIWLKVLYILISAALTDLLFWSGERGALVCVVLGATLVLLIFSFKNFSWKKSFLGGFIVVMILVFGFAIPPYLGKDMMLNRILPQESTGTKVNSSNNSDLSIINVASPVSHQVMENRSQFWPVYLKTAIKNPLGFGPLTHMSVYYAPGKYLNFGPHNTYIEIWIWGGLLGLGSFLYIIWSAFKNLQTRLRLNFNSDTVALIGILFAMTISILVNDNIQLFCFWVILALSCL